MSRWKKRRRAQFRKSVFGRDGYECVKCGFEDSSGDELDAHHIIDRDEMPNGGYVPENGITLCKECHRKAEVWHASDKYHCEEGYHPLTLFFLIDSSPEKARAEDRDHENQRR